MNAIIKKRSLGQFFTKNNFWIKDHILDFIKSTGATLAFDPFAGGGDLLIAAQRIGFKETKGFDIDKSLNWETNDSLLHIPKIEDSIIITNPPYLTIRFLHNKICLKLFLCLFTKQPNTPYTSGK